MRRRAEWVEHTFGPSDPRLEFPLTVFEPYGVWPKHDNKEWNRTLSEAKDRGWTLETHSNHSTMYLRCPTEDCKLGPIYSTAAGTENVARGYYDDVLDCPHSDDDQRAHAARARLHLTTGETYAGAARKQVEAAAAREVVEDLYGIASEAATMADEELKARDDKIINDIQVGEWKADDLDKEAQAVLAPTPFAGVTTPLPIVEAAADAAAQAEEVIKEDLSEKNDERAGLEDRLTALRADLDDLHLKISDESADT